MLSSWRPCTERQCILRCPILRNRTPHTIHGIFIDEGCAWCPSVSIPHGWPWYSAPSPLPPALLTIERLPSIFIVCILSVLPTNLLSIQSFAPSCEHSLFAVVVEMLTAPVPLEGIVFATVVLDVRVVHRDASAGSAERGSPIWQGTTELGGAGEGVDDGTGEAKTIFQNVARGVVAREEFAEDSGDTLGCASCSSSLTWAWTCSCFWYNRSRSTWRSTWANIEPWVQSADRSTLKSATWLTGAPGGVIDEGRAPMVRKLNSVHAAGIESVLSCPASVAILGEWSGRRVVGIV